MRRPTWSAGVRLALVAGLAVLMIAPPALAARRVTCPDPTIYYPSSVLRGTSMEVMLLDAEPSTFFGLELSHGGTAILGTGATDGSGDALVSVTVPADFPTGDAILGVAMATGCGWTRPITITQLILSSGAFTTTTGSPPSSIVIATTTTAGSTTTTGSTTSTVTTVAPGTTAAEEATSTTQAAGLSTPSTTSAEAPASVGSSSTIAASGSTLVAAASPGHADSNQAWIAWIVVSGLAGLTIGSVATLAAIKRGVIGV